MRVDQALRAATKKLQKKSESPHLDAEVLLAFVLHNNRTQLLTHPENKLTAAQLRKFHSLTQRRAKYTPIAYLTGQAEFFGLTLHITPAVLVPRPFTELLIEKLLNQCTSDNLNVTIADIGTGSGAIALTLAKHLPEANILATDISPAALQVAKGNARRLGLTKHVTFQKTSLLTSLSLQPDILVANLPYLTDRQLLEPSIRGEPKIALYGGRGGLILIRQLLSQAKSMPGLTTIVLEFDPPQLPAIRRYLKQWSPHTKIITINDGRRVRGLIAQKQTSRL